MSLSSVIILLALKACGLDVPLWSFAMMAALPVLEVIIALIQMIRQKD